MMLVIIPTILLVSGCTQTSPRVISASSLINNAEDYYGKPVAVVGEVSELGELFCPCFKLTSGGKSVQVWYDLMMNDDGTEMPAVSVEGIQNGDWVLISGKLTPRDPNIIFLAMSIEKTEPVVGGDKDEHGCIATAGYTWCESKQKCLRVWEEECPTLCTDEQRNADVCIEVYQPVCGWYDPDNVQCVTYPCAATYSNNCFACMDENVKYWTDGQCPVDDSGCDALCKDQGWQVGHCMWPAETCDDDVDIGLECYVESSRHCGNRDQCYCYCKNETKAGDESITSFGECIAAGYPAMESYPRQCMVPGVGTFTEMLEEKACTTDQDCVVMGESGECNCGCFSKSYEGWESAGACFCAAPTSCKCVDGGCEGVFGDDS